MVRLKQHGERIRAAIVQRMSFILTHFYFRFMFALWKGGTYVYLLVRRAQR